MYVHNKLKVEDLLNLDFKSLAEKMEALKGLVKSLGCRSDTRTANRKSVAIFSFFVDRC